MIQLIGPFDKEIIVEDTILAKLKDEHRDIKSILNRMQRSSYDRQKMFELYEELKEVLIPHMEGEEQTLYSALRTDVYDETAAELANRADFEHQEVRDILTMMDGEDISTAEWKDLFESLLDLLYQHFEEEEKELFNEAKEDFSRDELVRIGVEYEEAKNHASFM